jgi:hypothetical protein
VVKKYANRQNLGEFKMSKIVNVKFAGLGGQGILTCTDILGRLVFDLGFDVK